MRMGIDAGTWQRAKSEKEIRASPTVAVIYGGSTGVNAYMQKLEKKIQAHLRLHGQIIGPD